MSKPNESRSLCFPTYHTSNYSHGKRFGEKKLPFSFHSPHGVREIFSKHKSAHVTASLFKPSNDFPLYLGSGPNFQGYRALHYLATAYSFTALSHSSLSLFTTFQTPWHAFSSSKSLSVLSLAIFSARDIFFPMIFPLLHYFCHLQFRPNITSFKRSMLAIVSKEVRPSPPSFVPWTLLYIFS